jgi:hypothetical protein
MRTLAEVVELSTIENYNFARDLVDAGAWSKSMMREYLESKLSVITEIEIESSIEIEAGDVESVLHDVELARAYASRRANRSNGGYSHTVFERAFIERLNWLGYSRYENAIDSTVIAILERSKTKEQRKHS